MSRDSAAAEADDALGGNPSSEARPLAASVVVTVVMDRVKLFNATLVTIEASAILDHPTVLLTAKEPCTIAVRNPDQVLSLRRGFGRADSDLRATGWIYCGTNNHNNHNKCKSTAANEDDQALMNGRKWMILVCRVWVTTAIERNRKGRKILECSELLEVQKDVRMDTDELVEWVTEVEQSYQREEDQEVSSGQILQDKKIRHRLFASWLVETFGKERLASGTGVLDVAGGKGELGETFRDDHDIPSIVLDPLPRCDLVSPPFPIIDRPLEGDGSQIMSENVGFAHLMEHCSIITGMHPDQATEAIVDTAMRLGKPFAILPCCVMPKLFPHRMQQRHNQPVRSYSTFCQYLLDKAPTGCTFQVHHLPFDGRNKVIYFDFQCTPVIA